MGDFTRDELIEEVKSGLGRVNVGTDDITTPRYVRALNLAQTRIARKYNWSELQRFENQAVSAIRVPNRDYRIVLHPAAANVTAVINPKISLATFPKEILQVEIFYETRVTPLTKISIGQFRRIYKFHADSTTEDVRTGRPTVYTSYTFRDGTAGSGLKGMYMHFNLAPESDYNIRYIRVEWPTVFGSGGGDSGDKSDLYKKDDAIAFYALSRLLRQLGRPQDANGYFAEAEAMVADAMADDQHDADLVIKPRGLDDGTGARGNIANDPFVQSDHGDRW